MDEPTAADGSVLEIVRELLGELPGLVSDRVQLLALEVRRAARALARMLALAVAAAVLLCTAWLALWAGLALALVQAGWPWPLALALVIVLNVGAAAIALRRAWALSELVGLPATVRRLTQGPRHDPESNSREPAHPQQRPAA